MELNYEAIIIRKLFRTHQLKIECQTDFRWIAKLLLSRRLQRTFQPLDYGSPSRYSKLEQDR